MKRIALFSTLVAAGMCTAAPAFAATQTSGPADGEVGVPKAFVQVQPSAGQPGDNVVVQVGCEASAISHLTSTALDFGPLYPVGPQHDPAKAPVSQGQGTVRDGVQPGTYRVSFDCGSAEIDSQFTVQPATQVSAGARQSGGSADGLPAAAAAMGALAVGGTGLVLVRRRGRD
ncbi:hypothetical protein GCM10022222_24210 [Amycolatopsis ultiminotia]|uniref:Gram-positive cocci surface proteins LPxTG domain-containing protein n=1 Tax=Amycolatopsis ultiminotia TaxID=543629 RepID=A0ABP6VSN7_9PSEU